MFILLEKELGLCSTPDLTKTLHTAYKLNSKYWKQDKPTNPNAVA